MPAPSKIVESELTEQQIERIHCFGECWINNYNRSIRDHWKKALWLWAWDRGVAFCRVAPQSAAISRN